MGQLTDSLGIGVRLTPPPTSTAFNEPPPIDLAPSSRLVIDAHTGQAGTLTNSSAQFTIAPDVTEGPNTYIVQRGDSLWKIAKSNGWDVDALTAANPQLGDPNFIMEGQRINVLPPVATVNAFGLTVDNATAMSQAGAEDLGQEARQVSEGLVDSGATWKLTYDPDKLNNDQYAGGKMDNSVQSIITQALANHYRPGNGNTVREVIDTPALNAVLDPNGRPQFFKAPDAYTGYLLNSTNAWGRVTLPTDPLLLDLNGDGVKMTDYVQDPVLFDADNDGGSLEQTVWSPLNQGMSSRFAVGMARM